MPIRINLKELFPADAQEITIDKINFNFNKLLALGVGEPGPIGLSGIQGAAGPVGGVGSQGTRGSTWIVDAGSPTITTGLLDGDLYLDSTALAVWQWDEATSTWNFLFDISAIVQNYLSSSPSPFTRGFGSGSPNDQRFILFNKRDGAFIDDLQGSSSSLNDVLFLSNYDETVASPPPVLIGSPDTDDFYNALLTVSVDQRSGNPAIRSHIELGSLYGTLSPTLTSRDENFKLRYSRVTGSQHAGLFHYNKQTLSLDINDPLSPGNRNFSSVFEFQTPKYLPSSVNSFANVWIGSRYGLDEVTPSATSGSTLADGLVISTESYAANIGIAKGYVVPGITSGANTGYINNSSTKGYFMLDALSLTDGLFLNDKVYQTGGNIVQLGTTAARIVDGTSQGFSTPSSSIGHIGIASRGDIIYTFGADTNLVGPITPSQKAYFTKQSISNPNDIQTGPTTDFPPTVGAVTAAYATAGATQPDFAGISDIAVCGELMYVVNNQSFNLGIQPQTYFQILKLDEIGVGTDLKAYPIQLGKIEGVSQLDCAHRVELAGRYAIVATNALPHGSTPNNLSGPAASGYDGKILAIDVSCNDTPTVVDSAITTKAITAGTVKSAFMDLVVVDNYAYTLTWEQQVAILPATSATVRVHLDAFDISNVDSLSTITWKGRSNTTYFSSTVNPSQYANLSKNGAIDATSRYVYSAYSNFNSISSTYSLVLKIHNSLKGASQTSFNQVSNLVISTSASIKNVVDLKHVGNSVYILGNTASDEGYIYKIDVSNASAPFKVWERQITYNSINKAVGRFTIIGKHIYVAAHDTGGGTSEYGGLIAIDIDGFYTGGAHIESLRADELHTIKDAKIGQHLTINSDLNVGNDAKVNGSLGVGSKLLVCDDFSVVGNSTFGGNALVGGNLNVLGNMSAATSTATTQFIGPGTIPVGGIIMWSGSIASIPTGWALCNGTSGTPNLQDRFIVGAGSTYAVAATGGQDQITLTRANIPAHRHSGVAAITETASEALTSFATANASAGIVSMSREGRVGPDWSAAGLDLQEATVYYNTGDGTTNISNLDEVANGTGTVSTIDNKPLYYALAFIMRVV